MAGPKYKKEQTKKKMFPISNIQKDLIPYTISSKRLNALKLDKN